MEQSDIVDIVCRQTDYTRETALIKLKEYNNNYTQLIRDFMGIKPKVVVNKSASQERYKIIRHVLDKACKTYREKTE